jgi:hypothetical protein
MAHTTDASPAMLIAKSFFQISYARIVLRSIVRNEISELLRWDLKSVKNRLDSSRDLHACVADLLRKREKDGFVLELSTKEMCDNTY